MSPLPSLVKRRRRPPATRLLIGIPRLSPERELAAIRVLIKPQTKIALQHQIDSGEQRMSSRDRSRLESALAIAADALGFQEVFSFPAAGEYLAVAGFDRDRLNAALAVALLISRRLPGVWVTVGRLFVRDEGFFRRERGVRLWLRKANDIHLSRTDRANYREACRLIDEIDAKSRPR